MQADLEADVAAGRRPDFREYHSENSINCAWVVFNNAAGRLSLASSITPGAFQVYYGPSEWINVAGDIDREKAVADKLKEMGWLSPDEARKLRHGLAVAQQAPLFSTRENAKRFLWWKPWLERRLGDLAPYDAVRIKEEQSTHIDEGATEWDRGWAACYARVGECIKVLKWLAQNPGCHPMNAHREAVRALKEANMLPWGGA